VLNNGEIPLLAIMWATVAALLHRQPNCTAVIMLAAQIGDRDAGLMLLQNPDGLLFRKATALHAVVLVMGQSEFQPGLSP